MSIRWLLPAVSLALVGLLHCTSTVTGTGPAESGAATSSSGGDSPTCLSIGNVGGDSRWLPDVKNACPVGECVIQQNGCALGATCGPETFSGNIAGRTISWQDESTGDQCSLTVGPLGDAINGTCSGPTGACALSLAKR